MFWFIFSCLIFFLYRSFWYIQNLPNGLQLFVFRMTKTITSNNIELIRFLQRHFTLKNYSRFLFVLIFGSVIFFFWFFDLHIAFDFKRERQTEKESNQLRCCFCNILNFISKSINHEKRGRLQKKLDQWNEFPQHQLQYDQFDEFNSVK